MDKRPLLAFGRFSEKQRKALVRVAVESAFELGVVASTHDAARWLGSHKPHAMLLDSTTPGAEQAAVETRAEADHAQVPIIALTPELTDLTFAEAFGWGGDDVVGLDNPRALLGRLRALPKDAPEPPTNGRGAALIADADPTRRIVLGRVLRNAGYSVTFAARERDAQGFAQNPDIDLVVLAAELAEQPEKAIAESREGGGRATWIVTCPPRALGGMQEKLSGLERATATDGFGPAENVLFLANELSNGARSNQRRSQRLLFGATIAFRSAGRDRDDYGFSYNISAGGLYVRTLLPPEDDSVWLELTPPRSERRVRLVGKVVWRRGFGPTGTATVPPGFGVQITEGASADMDAWRSGYEAFALAMT
jgi:DNA-binding response OmpR family regulator